MRTVRDGGRWHADVARQRVLELGRVGQRPKSLQPQPSNDSVTVAPGTYEFYCMVHPQMHGTVIVQ